jgi:hypothetical protein
MESPAIPGRFNLLNFGIAVNVASSATIQGNQILNTSTSLSSVTNCIVQGDNNLFSGGSYATIRCSGSSIALHGNHILNAGGYSVLLQAFPNPPDVIIDLSNNYWGTTDTDTINAWIWDGNDTPYIHAFVQYEPFANAPIGTEQQSWGRVKALYR